MSCEPPHIFEEKKRTSRKEHKCCECYMKIEKGQKYFDVRGLWEGSWSNYKTCLYCEALRVWAVGIDQTMYPEDGPGFGNLREWCLDCGVNIEEFVYEEKAVTDG